MRSMPPRSLVLVAIVVLLVAGTASLVAQQPVVSSTIRIALVRQWVVNQHRVPLFAFERRLSPEFRAALESGVVDRTVFQWQRGAIQRWWLLRKPIGVLAGPEATALGARGQFEVTGVRPPQGSAAWTEVGLAARTPQPDDVLILEVGGEVNTETQVLGTLAMISRDGGLRELPLNGGPPRGDGVAVVTAALGEPIGAPQAAYFRGASGVDFLVVRSSVPVIANGGFTSNGVADLAIEGPGDWRHGDRVLIRVPLSTLRSGSPAIVLGWRDRITKPETGDGERMRPQALLAP
ncbi:MAG TPA: hypothetical protein VGX21_07830 [Methylomirabilota bacterium]|nr:hypothetical protein [Methylomirabilota bacterium]